MAIFKKQPKKAAETEPKENIEIKEEAKKETKKAEPKKAEPKMKAAVRFSRNVLVKPWVSERSTDLAALNKYVFLVDQSATKPLIKENIAKRYNVNVTDVDIVNIKGKVKYFRNEPHRRQSIKKAIITLKKGDKIEIQ